MNIGFDIGGVISKYPQELKFLMERLGIYSHQHNLYIITDQHPKDEVIKVLIDNDIMSIHAKVFSYVKRENIYCCDYEKYGNFAKAVLIKELKIDMFIDDFDGYLQWDSSFGPQPLLLKVMPDAFRPYWHNSWKQNGGLFGRRVFTNEKN
jgi:hypothetical protein